jgi:short-subunit dehydrogenase
MLALNDYNKDALDETVQILKPFSSGIFYDSFDVSNREKMFSLAHEVNLKFNKVDIVINNAGIGLGDYPFSEIDLDMFERVMNINFYGVLYGSRAFVPYLIKQSESALVNISSVFGLTGIAYASAYCSSKFAVYGLNQTLIQEYRNTSLTIHSVHPGGINTNISKNSLDYSPRHDAFHNKFLKLSPDYAARKITEGIKKKQPKILIGREAYQLDFIVRMFPVWGGKIVNMLIDKTRNEVARLS